MPKLCILEGRPTDEATRLATEIASYDLLDRLAIPFVRVDHAPAMTMEECAAIDCVLNMEICKNLFLCNRQKTQFYLLLMPSAKEFRTKELSAQIGSARLSFADADAMRERLNLTPGSVSILGLMHDTDAQVRLLIDRELLSSSQFGCHPCINTSSLRFSTKDLLEKLIPALGHEPTYVEL